MPTDASTLDNLAHLLAAMEQAITALSRVKQQGGGQMAPWDENTYFLAPVQTNWSIAGNTTTQILFANPMRVGFIISYNTGQTLFLGINANPANDEGIQLPPGTPPLIFLQKDWGSLVALDWYVNNFIPASPSTATVIEVFLRQFPGG